ncbi:hypothetical protein Tco_1571481 [Tanacetum coccineum]
MTSLPKCGALHDAVGGWDWAQMMILYCRRSAAVDRDFAIRMSGLLQEIKDEKRLQKLRNMEIDTVMKADQMERFIEKL